MFCVKCKKEIANGSVFCSWCGKKQSAETRAKHRRARGSGSISVDKRNHKRPYVARSAPLMKNTPGVHLGSFATRKEAQDAIDAFYAGKVTDLYNANLARIYELWKTNHFCRLKSDNSVVAYTAAFADLAPLHSRKMRELKTADFQQCIDTVAKKYSRSKCEKVKQLCSQLCKYAMMNDVMDKNYAQFLSLPQEEKKEKAVFTAAEIDLLWSHANDKRIQVILFMIYTGFRIGEVCTIRRENVFIDEGYIVGGIKTEAGTDRVVPFPPGIKDIERFTRLWLAEDDGSELLLNVSVGSLRNYWFYPALSELGLIDPPVYNPKSRKYEYHNPRLTPHSCRHTFASLSASAGMRPDDLQKIIGHASYETTAEIYVHKNIETLRAAMSKLSR